MKGQYGLVCMTMLDVRDLNFALLCITVLRGVVSAVGLFLGCVSVR